MNEHHEDTVWYLRNGDIEQAIACDRATAMQLLGAMSGYVGELTEEIDADGSLRALARAQPGVIFTKRVAEPSSAWAASVTP